MRFDPLQISETLVPLMVINNQKRFNCSQRIAMFAKSGQITAVKRYAHDIVAAFSDKCLNFLKIGFDSDTRAEEAVQISDRFFKIADNPSACHAEDVSEAEHRAQGISVRSNMGGENDILNALNSLSGCCFTHLTLFFFFPD